MSFQDDLMRKAKLRGDIERGIDSVSEIDNARMAEIAPALGFPAVDPTSIPLQPGLSNHELLAESAPVEQVVSPGISRSPASDIIKSTIKSTTSSSGPVVPPKAPEEDAESRLERMMRELNEERNKEREDAASRQMKANIFKAITDNVGNIVGGAQAMNTKASVNPVQVKGFDPGDLIAGVDKKFSGDREALLDQYKQLLNARDKSEQRKYQQDSLKIQRDGLALKEKALNQKAATQLNKFGEEIYKNDADRYSETQKMLPNINKNIDAVEDALNSQLKYSSTNVGGTGKLATGFGLKKLFDNDTEALDSKFKNINLKNMVTTFSGMSKAVDTDAERKAWEATQADTSNDDSVNVNILLGAKSSLLKDRAIAQAQQQWVKQYGNLNGFDENNPILQGQISTVVSPSGEMQLIPKSQVQEAEKSGYKGLDKYAKELMGSTKKKLPKGTSPRDGTPSPSFQQQAPPSTVERLDTKSGKIAIFDSKTKQFIKFKD